MYEFINEKTQDEFEKFMSDSRYGNFLQASVWAKVKKDWGSERIVSRSDNGEVRAAMLVLVKKVPHMPFSFLYAPRGPVCEPDEKEGMKDLVDALKVLAKKYHAYMFKCDPSFRADDERVEDAVKYAGFKLKKIGKNFDGIQPHFVFRLDIEGKSYDQLFEAFASKTRYNIRLASRKGVTVREGERSELERFFNIMQETGERDNFGIRPLWYFEHMYDVMKDENLKFYVAEFEGEIIAGTIAIYYGDKVWYLYGASSNSHRNVMPNYLLQVEMIKWAIEKGCRTYDFRGVSGDISEDNPLYGLYRFKKGFSGDLIEFAGELEITYKPLVRKAADFVAAHR